MNRIQCDVNRIYFRCILWRLWKRNHQLFLFALLFPLVIPFFSVSQTLDICFNSFYRIICHTLQMCRTITYIVNNSPLWIRKTTVKMFPVWARALFQQNRCVHLYVYVWDFLIFISTDAKLKPRQNEFISTQIFSLNKYNKIFCACVVNVCTAHKSLGHIVSYQSAKMAKCLCTTETWSVNRSTSLATSKL